MVALHEQMAILAESLRQQEFDAGGGDTTVQIGTVTLPENPTRNVTVSVLADSDTVLPEGVTWDSGGEPTITERMLLVFVWSGTDWVGTYGPSIPDAPIQTDETGPTAGTLGVVVGITSADGTVTGAEDETELDPAPYDFGLDGVFNDSWQAGNTYEWTGLTAETEYDFQHRVRDAAGNITEGAAVTDTTAAASFDVLNLSPAVWLDASDTATLTESGGNVSGWADKSGNARHFTRSGGIGDAQLSSLNGLTALDWAQSRFVGPNDPQLFAGAGSAWAVYFVGAPTNVSTQLSQTNSATSTEQTFRMYTNTGDRNARLLRGTAGVLTKAWSGRTLVSWSTWDGTTATLGDGDDSITHAVGAATAETAPLFIGALGSASLLLGKVAEIVILDTMPTPTEHADLLSYFAAKWGADL